MLTCLNVLDGIFVDKGLQSLLVSTVHDSMVIDAKRDELPFIHEMCTAVVNNLPEIMPLVLGDEPDLSWMDVVPIQGDSEVGVSYYGPKKIAADPQTGGIDWDRLLAPDKTKG